MAENKNTDNLNNGSSYISDSELSQLSPEEMNFFDMLKRDIPKPEPKEEAPSAAVLNDEDLNLLRSMRSESKASVNKEPEKPNETMDAEEMALFAAVNESAKRKAEMNAKAQMEMDNPTPAKPEGDETAVYVNDEVDMGKTISVENLASAEIPPVNMDKTIKIEKTKSGKKDKKNKVKRPWWQKILLGLWSFVKIIFWYICIAVAALAAGLVIFIMCLNQFEDPELDVLFANRSLDQTTTIWAQKVDSEEYEQIAELYLDENREWVNYEEMPECLINALVSIEDERFWTHNGVDWKRTAGAIAKYIAGVDDFGGSTITQQLIKNITGDNDYSWQRKAKEILRALYIEKKYDKKDILEYYLNTVYFNYRAYGVGKAAELYYNKDVRDLNAAESAALVGIVQMPASWEPYYHPDANTERKELVLGKMLELGYLNEKEYEQAMNYHIRLNPNGVDMQYDSNNSYYVDQVINDCIRDIAKELNMEEDAAEVYFYKSGLKVYTCLDQEVQAALDHCFIEDESWWPEPDIDEDYQSAMYIMDPHNGKVFGIAGGRGEKVKRGLDRATQSPRQTGSSIKPLSVYGPGIEEEVITMGSVVDDVPLAWFGANPYPQNVSHEFNGKVTMYQAIRSSLNATPAQILQTLSYQTPYEYLTERMHFQSLCEDDINVGAMALGGLTYGATVAEMTAGYAAVANGGVYTEPITYTRIEYSDGRVLIDKVPETNRVFSEQTAWLLQYLLVDGVKSGFASVDLNMPVAGKTGTTDSGVDKWYMAYTPYFASGIWVGYDENNISLDGAGVMSTISRYAWKHVIDEVIEAKGWEGGELQEQPDGIVQASYCLDCGGAPTEYCSMDPRGDRIGTAYYKEGTTPGPCTCHTPVYICKESGMVAHNGCPDAEVKCLVLTERAFSQPVGVPDANYMWMNIPEGILPSFDGVAFQNVLGIGNNVGTAEGVQTNHLCTVHSVPAGQEVALYNPNNVVSATCTITPKSNANAQFSFVDPVQVNNGESFTFTVTARETYEISSVLAGGAILTPDSGDNRVNTYTIPAVTDNISVSVKVRKVLE